MVYHAHGFAELLSRKLRAEASAARRGWTDSARYVIRAASRVENYWRWLRSSSLGYPLMNLAQACILSVLAEAGSDVAIGAIGTSEILTRVASMRRLFRWWPAGKLVADHAVGAARADPGAANRSHSRRRPGQAALRRIPARRLFGEQPRDGSGLAFAEWEGASMTIVFDRASIGFAIFGLLSLFGLGGPRMGCILLFASIANTAELTIERIIKGPPAAGREAA